MDVRYHPEICVNLHYGVEKKHHDGGFTYGKRKKAPRKKMSGGQNPRADANEQRGQHGRHPEPVQGDHCRIYGEWLRFDSELDYKLGYSKYYYKNKSTDNGRNRHSNKTLRTSFGNVDISIPHDRKGEF
jgi:hypothetical protein